MQRLVGPDDLKFGFKIRLITLEVFLNLRNRIQVFGYHGIHHLTEVNRIFGLIPKISFELTAAFQAAGYQIPLISAQTPHLKGKLKPLLSMFQLVIDLLHLPSSSHLLRYVNG